MKHPDYQLRPNKAVDRLLLVDVVRRLNVSGKELTYYGFGGPFLEDLRVMDHFFPEMKLVSIESDPDTFERQNFNKFSSRLDLRHRTLDDFLAHDFRASSGDIFWLDYTDLRYSRLTEFQRLLMAVKPDSIVRITVRADPDINFSHLNGKLELSDINRIKTNLKELLKKQFNEFLGQIDNDEGLFFPDKYAQMVQEMIRRASLHAFRGQKKFEYLPLQSIRYSDGVQMLSVTGIVCRTEVIDTTRENFKDVRFANLDWHKPEQIDMPALSMKERLHLEKHLPFSLNSGEEVGEFLYNLFKYSIDKNVEHTKAKLAHYADCEREFPSFVRIS